MSSPDAGGGGRWRLCGPHKEERILGFELGETRRPLGVWVGRQDPA